MLQAVIKSARLATCFKLFEVTKINLYHSLTHRDNQYLDLTLGFTNQIMSKTMLGVGFELISIPKSRTAIVGFRCRT